MRKEFKVTRSSVESRLTSNVPSSLLELLREAERVRQNGARTPAEKIDIYHETAEACRSAGEFGLQQSIWIEERSLFRQI